MSLCQENNCLELTELSSISKISYRIPSIVTLQKEQFRSPVKINISLV